MNFSFLINKLINKRDLTDKEANYIFNRIMSGKCSDLEISAFLVGLSSKGESINEILQATKVLRKKCIKIKSGAPNGAPQGGARREEDLLCF